MKNVLIFLVLANLLACKSNTNKEIKTSDTPSQKELKVEINKIDDSLRFYYQQIKENKIQEIHSLYFINAIEKNLAYYRAYPKDAYAAECLDKVQQLMTQQKSYEAALSYCDTLVEKYPNYKGVPVVLLNAGSIADGILNNKDKVKLYYNKLLKNYPSIDKETKEMVQFRLKHIDLSFDEMIELQIKNSAKK